jgi:DNA-binding NarL/FixJ family response regulator
MRVLIADDSELICERIAGCLQVIPGIHIRTEPAARTVLRAADTFMPDLVILDIQMAYARGLEVLAELKQVHPGRTVIVLTDAPGSLYRTHSMNAGADFFFNKSSEFTQTVEVIKRLAADRTVESPIPERSRYGTA